MNLLQASKLSPGTNVFYKGQPTQVLWTENVKEQVCVEDGEPKFATHTAVAIKPSLHEAVTLRSCWPRPEEVDFEGLTAQ